MTNAQNDIEPRACFVGASVDQTEAPRFRQNFSLRTYAGVLLIPGDLGLACTND